MNPSLVVKSLIMVNITSLEKICRFVHNEKAIKKMKPWSERYRFHLLDNKHSWYLRKLKNQVVELLSIISGDDIVKMLKGSFKKKIKKYFQNFIC